MATNIILAAPQGPTGRRETETRTIKLIVISYDPILRAHGGARLREFMKWNDPRPMTTNLMRYLRETSGGFARYKLVEGIDGGGFSVERGGFR